MSCDQSHYYRQVWYWGGEADLRVNGKKMELTTIASEEWDQVVKDAESFWDELASISPRAARVIDIFKKYNATMEKVVVPRSEEHTSELQSIMRISYAYFCLKKIKTQNEINTDKNNITNT